MKMDPPPSYDDAVAQGGNYYQVTPTAPAFVQPTSYGAATITIQPSMPQSQVIIIGGCPACRIGVLDESVTCCGLCCAIFCFPLGILFCLATKQKRCKNCGAIFS